MNIYVSQIYIEVGANYPFTHHFQKFLSRSLSDRIVMSRAFATRYGDDFDLIFNMSAKSELEDTEIKGPTVFKRDKYVEYSIFLPYREHNHDPKMLKGVVVALLAGIARVLEDLDFDAASISDAADEWAERIVGDPVMIEESAEK